MHDPQRGVTNPANVDTAIVLAGGLGTRLRDVVPDLPKPMAPVNGRPFLEHQIDYWLEQGIRRFILSVGYRREVIMAHFGGMYRGAAIDYAIEDAPLGTGGGLMLAVGKLGGSGAFLLLNGDTFFEVPLAGLAAFHAANGADWTFSLFRTSEAGRYMGMDVDAAGRILSLKSGAGHPGRLANGGVYLVDTGVLRGMDCPSGRNLSLEDDLLPQLFKAGKQFWGYECDGRFIDIGVPDDYFRTAKLLMEPGSDGRCFGTDKKS